MPDKEPRQLVVVDVESTGLDHRRHVAVEVAWHNLTTDQSATFLPRHSVLDGWRADKEALAINRYEERLRGKPHAGWAEVGRLYVTLGGATLVGANPAFDARMLEKVFARYGWRRGQRTPWHHRMLDVSNIAAAVLGLPFHELPGLAKVCQLLDVPAPDHTAAGDVRATVHCLRKLMAMGENAPARFAS